MVKENLAFIEKRVLQGQAQENIHIGFSAEFCFKRSDFSEQGSFKNCGSGRSNNRTVVKQQLPQNLAGRNQTVVIKGVINKQRLVMLIDDTDRAGIEISRMIGNGFQPSFLPGWTNQVVAV